VTGPAAILGDALIRWDWVREHLSCFGPECIRTRAWEHILLTVLAVGIGLAISLPVGIFAQRHRRAYTPITSAAGILYTIPSISLFVVLIPLTRLTYYTAQIALVSYTLLILIRNVVAGLNGVPEDAKEAALGMGYTNRQLLWRVEIPLAAPVIIAGIRVATVSTIGLVTITALLGFGGFGHFILAGLRTFFTTETLLGAVLSLVLAVVADALLVSAGSLLTPWTRRRRLRGFIPGRGAEAQAA
jgi:osmoprotectant transport system permease protein